MSHTPKIPGILNGVTTIQTNVSTLQTDVDTVESNITTLQSDITTLQSDVSTLQTNSTETFTNTYSLSFDGTNDYVDCGTISSLSGASAQTLSVWFKPTVSGVIPNIGWWASSSLSYGWSSTSDHTVQVFNVKNGVNESFNITSSVPNDTDWHNYVVTFDSGSVVIYIDGSSVLTGTASNSTLATQTGSFRIGQFGTVALYESGLYDEVALFSSALSSSDVTSLYNSGVPNDISSLSPHSWWRMEEGTGTSVVNTSNSGTNDGTLNNGPAWSTTIPS